jgi:glucose/arabinose dehydrogenase
MNLRRPISIAFFGLASCTAAKAGNTGSSTERAAVVIDAPACVRNDAGLRLPPGFCATIFADSIGSARHMVVAPNGDVFVNLQPTRRGPVASIPAGVVGLRDTNADGRADVVERFGTGGNTGIALYDGYLYADVGTSIVRYSLPAGQLRAAGSADTIVSGLPGQPGHVARNFVITRDGTLFVNIGSPSNACQLEDRKAGSPGKENCPELATRAGIWKFNATSLKQKPTLESRYATGLRNSVALTLDQSGNRLFAVPHGRDQLSGNWPSLFTTEQNAELPGEMFVEVGQGADYGWPYCYYDGIAHGYRLAPEYGGDGKSAGRCARLKEPIYSFPAHWAPNAVQFYTGRNFPERYRGGVFVAFHGSWNRAPLPQAGFNVVFLPMSNGRAQSQFEFFAEGFSIPNPPQGGATHRPSGLAVAPDGALYISDDVGGRIYRVTWAGT